MSIAISVEDENYLRSCMLIDIGRRAIKVCFDREFHPKRLNDEIKTIKYRKLEPLFQNKVITKIQWEVLNGKNLNSSDFDISLMICLLNNLTDLRISNVLPHSSFNETADNIVRIKFYRNAIVHANRGYFSDENFQKVKNTVSEAIQSISQKLYEECVRLDKTGLNLLNKNMFLMINKAIKEMSDCKEIKKKQLKELNKLKTRKSNPIPPETRVEIATTLEKWRKDDNEFVRTKGSKAVLEAIKKRHCVAVTGSFGVGKTAVLQNVALHMSKEGFIIVPIRHPSKIQKYNHPVQKNLFVVDNFCGEFVLDEETIKAWNRCYVAFGETCKLLVSCKLHVYKALQLNNIAFHECNLVSKDMCMSLNERQTIAFEYSIDISEIVDYIECYNCFPLLCKTFQKEDTINANSFFKTPLKVFEKQFKMLDTGKVCALLTILMCYDNLPEAKITGAEQSDVKDIIKNTSNACKLNTQNSCLTIHKELENVIDTYVVKTGGAYHALNESIFNLLLRYFGQLMTDSLINYACTSLIKERFQLSNPLTEKEDYHVDNEQEQVMITYHIVWDKVGLNAVILDSFENRKLYINRMIIDWSKGYVKEVFQNPNIFHEFFFELVNTIGAHKLGQLMKKTDILDGSTPIIVYCDSVYYDNFPSTNYCDVFFGLVNS